MTSPPHLKDALVFFIRWNQYKNPFPEEREPTVEFVSGEMVLEPPGRGVENPLYGVRDLGVSNPQLHTNIANSPQYNINGDEKII